MFDPQPILSGNRRALARTLTEIENATPTAEAALAALFPHTGRAHLIGVTGSPGAGKSSLVNELAKALRHAEQTVGIVAVDPTSPFTGGAILGDRIRMRDLSGDSGVFIRSMASRGSLGGLAQATGDVVRAMDAAGFDRIIIETVGAGQAEVEIARYAHTTLVVEAPGLGDDVQGIKAGILEIADILILNKADQPGVEVALRALRTSLELAPKSAQQAAKRWTNLQAHHHLTEPLPTANHDSWTTPLLQTVATTGQGLAELIAAIDQHRAYLRDSGAGQRHERDRLRHELHTRLRNALLTDLIHRTGPEPIEALVEQILTRLTDPATATRQLLRLETRD